jgi:hypothetical protein
MDPSRSRVSRAIVGGGGGGGEVRKKTRVTDYCRRRKIPNRGGAVVVVTAAHSSGAIRRNRRLVPRARATQGNEHVGKRHRPERSCAAASTISAVTRTAKLVGAVESAAERGACASSTSRARQSRNAAA